MEYVYTHQTHTHRQERQREFPVLIGSTGLVRDLDLRLLTVHLQFPSLAASSGSTVPTSFCQQRYPYKQQALERPGQEPPGTISATT